MFVVAALSLAAAQEPEAPRTVVLEPPEESGGSALDELDADAREEARSAPMPLRLAATRGRVAFRPVLQTSFLAGGPRTFWAMRIGLVVTHRWWSLDERTVQLAGQTDLRASAPFGAATGRRFVLSSTLGPWVGPVGLQVGPVVRSDRTEWRTPALVNDDTLALGGRGDLAVQLGNWRAFAGLEIAWLALGNRAPANGETATLPVIGDETAYRLGVGRQGDRLLVALLGNWRETTIGAEVDVGLRFGLRLL